MKKALTLLIVFIISIGSINISVADSISKSSNSAILKDVKYFAGKNQDKIVIPLENYKGYKFMRLDNPDRIVIDIPNTIGPSAQVKQTTNGVYVKTVRYAANGTNVSRIVLDVVGKPQYFVEEAKGQLIIYVVSQMSKNLFYYIDSSSAALIIKGAKFSTGTSYSGTADPSGKKYTLTFPSNLADIDNKKITVNDVFVDYISVIKDVRTKKTSMIFYAKDKFIYNVVQRIDVNGFAVKISKAAEPGRGDDVRNEDTPFKVAYSMEANLDKISLQFMNYAGYKIQRLTNPDRIVVDVPNSQRSIADNQIMVNSIRIKSLQYSQYDENTTRVVIDLNGQYQYHTLENNGELALYIEDPSFKNINYSNNGTASLNLNGISLFSQDGQTKLYSESLDSTGKMFTITFPNDLGDLGSGILQVNDDSVSTIVLQRDSVTNQSSITFIAKANFHYNIAPLSGGTFISLGNLQPVKNIKYYNSGDWVHFILSKVKLTEGADGSVKHYTSSYDGNRFIITFQSKYADLSPGFMNINDSYLDSVQIVNDASTGNTSIILNAKGVYKYLIIYRELTKDTSIDIMKPSTDQEKLVVIDAGHGGADPGAVNSGVQEKNLNLDIALRLEALLKSKGIKTYMTRQDDNYVGLYERAFIANELNAKAFICIHNNAYYSSYSGTETLYYGNTTRDGFNCKSLAQIVQNNLIADLGTVNRGIVPRPDLVVLHATKMPAILAEIGFITNDNDRKKLLTDDFKQRAAQSLCNSVIESLGKM